jgi:hypothetical protein
MQTNKTKVKEIILNEDELTDIILKHYKIKDDDLEYYDWIENDTVLIFNLNSTYKSLGCESTLTTFKRYRFSKLHIASIVAKRFKLNYNLCEMTFKFTINENEYTIKETQKVK